ncbi:MAG TPA: Clp protease N-terminal domain-containing protein [Candidatus Limnocylindrales bacterium]|nr:Clp protease N-terminal domain-containing protein [Candidatus Limnocylindrales bacterium]
MATTLSNLIDEVEQRSPSNNPLDLLATAAATVEEVTDAADALLSHFVDRTRRAGHSWTEIGAALGVTKQAVQKRFTGDEKRNPRGWERFTDRARAVASKHAFAASEELGNNYVGTEHLLLAMWGEPEGLAALALVDAGLTRETVIEAIDARIPRGAQGRGGFTPRAWVAIENSTKVAIELGHNYVGTEHLLLSLMTGVGGVADEILGEKGVKRDKVEAFVLAALKS